MAPASLVPSSSPCASCRFKAVAADSLALYSYWRSSAAYRVRIALNLKGLVYTQVPVHLVDNGGEQHSPGYRALNPQELVPMLQHGKLLLRQSLAIIEYLDEVFPTPALLPSSSRERARVRALAQAVACEIHPLNNLRVQQYLEHALGADAGQRMEWTRHWIGLGFSALEDLLADDPATGDFCAGHVPSLADCLLVPQVYNARRFGVDMAAYPTISRIEAHCLDLPAFANARPELQPDAPVPG